MAKHLETGQKGEALAVEFLKTAGYQVLETNWRFSRAEVDIIAKDGEILVFVEVKTRTSDYFGQPEEAITERKKTLLADAASVYMDKIDHNWEIRFDVIAVVLKNEKAPIIEHFKDAFWQ